MGHLRCAREHSVQFFVQFFFTQLNCTVQLRVYGALNIIHSVLCAHNHFMTCTPPHAHTLHKIMLPIQYTLLHVSANCHSPQSDVGTNEY
jgi:hypothetical protein